MEKLDLTNPQNWQMMMDTIHLDLKQCRRMLLIAVRSGDVKSVGKVLQLWPDYYSSCKYLTDNTDIMEFARDMLRNLDQEYKEYLRRRQ